MHVQAQSPELAPDPADVFDPRAFIRDFGDIGSEAAACRTQAGLFDFSFMSVARISGPDAITPLRAITDRRLDDMAAGRIRYALRSDDSGYLQADLTVWRENADSYLLISGRRRDILDLGAAAHGSQSTVTDLSDQTAIFAVQGPATLAALEDILDTDQLSALPYFGFTELELDGVPCHIGRLGYTGERGFEIILPAAARQDVWNRLEGRARACGFAAIDRLRIEAGFVLFANEFRLPVTAAEAGLENFGTTEYAAARVRLACFRAETDTPPVLWQPGAPVAPPAPGTITVTSACHSALAGGVLGFGFVPAGETDRKPTDPTGEFHRIELVPRPFYDTDKLRPRGAWT